MYHLSGVERGWRKGMLGDVLDYFGETFAIKSQPKSYHCKITEESMCTVSIKVDNETVRRINPNLKNNDSFERWVQHYVDEFIHNLSANEHPSLSPNAHSTAEMRDILKERIRRAEAGEEKVIPNTEVFAQIDSRYGF